MGAVLGLGVGVGLLLVLSAWFAPLPARTGPRRPGRVARRLQEAGLGQVRPRTLVTASVVCGLLALLTVQVLSRTLPVAVAFGLIAGNAPFAVVRSRARRRQRELAEVWPEAVDNLASAVRAGMSLPEAISGLSERGPEPLRGPFAAFALDYQVSGRFSESLDLLKGRLADPVGDRVVEGLRVAREVGGGDLGRLLRSLSQFLRDDLRTRSELEARQAWAVNGARLAVAAPWIVLLLLCFQPEVIARYSTTAGVLVLAGGAGLCALAYRLMLLIGRLPTERRVLA